MNHRQIQWNEGPDDIPNAPERNTIQATLRNHAQDLKSVTSYGDEGVYDAHNCKGRAYNICMASEHKYENER